MYNINSLNYYFYDFSPVPPPVSGVFAGDMKNLKLSNSVTSSLQTRSFNASENIEMEGVSYYGMISGKVGEI